MRPMSLHFLHAVLWATALSALLASAWWDLKERIVPNRLVGFIGLAGLGLGVLLRFDQLWISLVGSCLLLVALGTLAHFRVMGGGDVKLLSATALLFPPGEIGRLILYTALAGGALSAAYLLARRIVRRHAAAGEAAALPPGWRSAEYARIAADCPVPYALAILGGVAAVLAEEVQRCLYVSSCSF